jgi:dTDP-4-dehydrorhamnose reductase
VALLELGTLELAGPLHVAAPDACSRYAFARLLRAAAGVDPEGIRAGLAPRSGRARNVALDSSKAAELLVARLRGVAATMGPSA